MMYKLWKEIKSCVENYEDGFKREEYKTTFHLVKQTETEIYDFGEHIADRMGEQDYNLSYDFIEIGLFDENDLIKITKEINLTF